MNEDPPMQPGGDIRASEDFSLLEESLDNLTQHLNHLGLDGEESKQASKNMGMRKLTVEDTNELRNHAGQEKFQAAKSGFLYGLQILDGDWARNIWKGLPSGVQRK